VDLLDKLKEVEKSQFFSTVLELNIELRKNIDFGQIQKKSHGSTP
jgi:hypothetical protein